MYKLFLCLRYLRLKFIAYIPMGATALCVAMMLIAVSVMNGILHKIETAAKGLYGDIVVDSASSTGIPYYDEFAAEIKAKLPQMQLKGVRPLKAEEIKTSPFIYTVGIVDTAYSDLRQYVQVAGIRFPDRLDVSSFRGGLFFQKDLKDPTFDPPFSELQRRLGQTVKTTEQLLQKQQALALKDKDPDAETMVHRIENALGFQQLARSRLAIAEMYEKEMLDLQRQIDQAQAHPGSMKEEQVDQLREKLNVLSEKAGVEAPDHHIILGLGLPGFVHRTWDEDIRVINPGLPVTLTLLPMGRKMANVQDIRPVRETFTVVDDCSTDVSSVDSNTVYLPFEMLQRLNNMAAKYDPDDPAKTVMPARCSQLHVRIWKGSSPDKDLNEEQLQRIAGAIDRLWQDFSASHGGAGGIMAQTWRQRQAGLINQFASQRTLVVIMFGLMSTVALWMIVVIFYMIVLQKTKDIGVIKALGGSGGGVAGIFLGYGAAVGLVGALIGTGLGWLFVYYINPIHSWVGRTFGLVIWTREGFLFDKIPNETDSAAAAIIIVGAMAAGLIGALLPAVIAGNREPVETLRYE